VAKADVELARDAHTRDRLMFVPNVDISKLDRTVISDSSGMGIRNVDEVGKNHLGHLFLISGIAASREAMLGGHGEVLDPARIAFAEQRAFLMLTPESLRYVMTKGTRTDLDPEYAAYVERTAGHHPESSLPLPGNSEAFMFGGKLIVIDRSDIKRPWRWQEVSLSDDFVFPA
jgi:hypothetical protein